MVKKVGPYELRTIIGRGTFGTVYLGKHSLSGTEIAVKVISKESLKPELQSRLEQEIQCQRSVNSEFIVKLLDVQKTENNFYLILEFCKGGDLGSFLKKFGKVNEVTAQRWLRQIVEAFRVLNEKNIIHRDLKLQNILLTELSEDANLKLADFGLSRFLEDDLARTWVGTPLYMAPEIVNCQEYDSKADIWSLGLVLYELVTGSLPLKVARRDQIPEAQKKIEPAPEYLSADCRDLLSKLLAYYPKDRISFPELFNHPFISARKETSESLSDFDEDFILLDRDESVNETLVVLKDLHPMINIQGIIDETENQISTANLLWSIGSKYVQEGETLNGCCLFVEVCEVLEKQVLEILANIKKFALVKENFPKLFEKFSELKQVFVVKLKVSEESLGIVEKLGMNKGTRVEKELVRYAVELCNQASQSEFLKGYQVSMEKYQDALRIFNYMKQKTLDSVSDEHRRLNQFASETLKRLENVKTKLCLE